MKQWNGKMATATLLFVLKVVQTHTHFILVSKKQTVLVAVSIDSRKNITCNNESGTCSLLFYFYKIRVYYIIQKCLMELEAEVRMMLDRVQALEDRYEKLNELLSDQDVISDSNKLRDNYKEQKGLEETVLSYRNFTDVKQELTDAEAMLEDDLDQDIEEMVKMEIAELTTKLGELEEQLKILLLPKDHNDDKNVIMEIRAAAGGDEAALFAGDLYRMYSRYAESFGWKTEVIEVHTTGVGGYKEIIFMIHGKGVFSKLKFENGTHR